MTARRPRFRWTSKWGDHNEPGYNKYAFGYDVKCSACGWESRTGGAIRAYVLRAIDDHLLDHGIVAVDGKPFHYFEAGQ